MYDQRKTFKVTIDAAETESNEISLDGLLLVAAQTDDEFVGTQVSFKARASKDVPLVDAVADDGTPLVVTASDEDYITVDPTIFAGIGAAYSVVVVSDAAQSSEPASIYLVCRTA